MAYIDLGTEFNELTLSLSHGIFGGSFLAFMDRSGPKEDRVLV